MILSVVVILGFSGSFNNGGENIKNNSTQPDFGFQIEYEFSNRAEFDEVSSLVDTVIEPSLQITDTLIISATATIPPVPTYTLIFPEITEESQLFQINRQPVEKQSSPQYLRAIRRYWPILLLVILWTLLGLWFLFSQMIIK